METKTIGIEQVAQKAQEWNVPWQVVKGIVIDMGVNDEAEAKRLAVTPTSDEEDEIVLYAEDYLDDGEQIQWGYLFIGDASEDD